MICSRKPSAVRPREEWRHAYRKFANLLVLRYHSPGSVMLVVISVVANALFKYEQD